MANENVIRHDVVQLDFITNIKELTKLNKEVEDLKKKLGGVSGEEIDKLKEKAKESQKPVENLKKKVEDLKKKLTEVGKKAATAAFNGLKKVAGISFKALTIGITGAATAIGVLVKNSVSAYAEFEQLFGGMQTLLGAKGATNVQEYAKLMGKTVGEVQSEYKMLAESEKLVMKNANNAFKTAGLSANQYMETVTSFSAALTSSLGGNTLEAAKLADTAIKDMADNANKMGTPMESIQTVYSNLARGMYMTLDNLKLGYAGTKEGAKQLVNDAAKIDKSVKANDLSYANLVKAIHAVQVKMDIYGTTSKEAFKTITGSLSTFKAAWSNLLPAMIQGGDQFDQCIDNLIGSIVGFENEAGELEGGIIKNVMPAIEKALMGVGTLIEKLSPTIEKELPKLIDTLLPPLLKAATALLKGFIKALPDIVGAIVREIPDILKQVGEAIGEAFSDIPILSKFGDVIADNAGKISKFIPVLLGLVGAFMAFKKVSAITSVFSGIFGKGGKGGAGGGEKGGLFSGFEQLAKMKTTTVLKGMANLAIIFGGFTLIVAAFMAVAPYLAKLSDIKSLIEVIVTIGALGYVGSALAQFAGTCGKIPVGTVLKGLANMAIVIAGMSALFLLVGAVSLLKFDYMSMLKIVAIMGVLGAVGAAVAVFAGIVGLIPIPVVLLGLANMALVLGGLTGIIVAFGALSKIAGLKEFIATGGELLAQLFGVIGKIAGSLIGGLAEGITNALPAIGKNIADFALAIQPMFDVFKGVDMGGVGTFFGSLGGFLLTMTANDILSFFTGGTDFKGIAKGLNTLAGEGTKKFFDVVKTIPKVAFENAKLFFDVLDNISGLPNTGGIGQLFTGKNDFAGVATGLGKLASEGVKKFFTMAAGLKDIAFENAKSLFKCLDGIHSLPNSGGLGQLFTGKNDFSGVASGLKSLSSEGVKNFFAMVSGLKADVFNKTTLLFKSLADINEVGDVGFWEGVGNFFSGEDSTSGLKSVASGLKTFAEQTSGFFAMVSKLDLGKLNGLWLSLEGSTNIAKTAFETTSEQIDKIAEKIQSLPEKMGEALKGSSENLSTAIVEMWEEAVKASVQPVNKLLSGANHILKEFGSKKKVIEWQPYARGTDGHKGGNALVNDGRGAELIQLPNGRMFIPNGKNVFIPNAPKGMKVMTAENTAQLMGRNSPTFRYAEGTGNIDVWSYYDNAKGLVDKLQEGISYKGMSSFAASVGKGIVSTFAGEMPAWIDKLFEEGGQGLSSYVASKGVKQWLPTVVRALKMEGQYSLPNVARTLFQMKTESGGNPKAINLWDSNAKKGIPSKGLMQVIDPTFKAYAREGFNKNIYDPLSNILASIRYAVSRYGSLAKAYKGKGYANGGFANSPSIFGEDGLEAAIPLSPSKRNRGIGLWKTTGAMLGLNPYSPEGDSGRYESNHVEHNTYAPQFTANFYGTGDDRTLSRKVKRWIGEAMEETFETLERKSGVIREV